MHNATAEDPRVALIELKPRYVSYWKATVGTLGFFKEVGLAAVKGEVADTGVQRQLLQEDIQDMRKAAETPS